MFGVLLLLCAFAGQPLGRRPLAFCFRLIISLIAVACASGPKRLSSVSKSWDVFVVARGLTTDGLLKLSVVMWFVVVCDCYDNYKTTEIHNSVLLARASTLAD